MKSITPTALQQLLQSSEPLLLIDVREPFEHTEFNIGGTLIPMQTVMSRLAEIPTSKPVILYCAKGIRSAIIIQRLEEKFGYTNLTNLQGGMYAWRATFGDIV